jgi:hypothetical protein
MTNKDYAGAGKDNIKIRTLAGNKLALSSPRRLAPTLSSCAVAALRCTARNAHRRRSACIVSPLASIIELRPLHRYMMCDRQTVSAVGGDTMMRLCTASRILSQLNILLLC